MKTRSTNPFEGVRKPLLFASLSLFSVILFAQESIDYRIFIDSSHVFSALFRAELPANYGSRIPNDNSTFYAYSEQFETGSVLFRGREYHHLLLNLNADRDELCVMDPSGGIVTLLNKNYVDSFSMGGGAGEKGGRCFVHIREEANGGVSAGYYQVLYSGKVTLYKKIRKSYSEKIGLSVEKKYLLSESFYLWKEERWYKIATKGDLKKHFPERKREIVQLSRTRDLNFRTEREHSLIATLSYLDNR